MAQVRKYQNGGGTYGTFTQNGNKINLDEDTLRRIATVSPSAANALRRGSDVSVETDANGITRILGINDSDISSVNDRRKHRLQRRSNIFEGRALKQERDSYDTLAKMVFEPSTQTVNHYKFDSDIDVEYEKDDKGEFKKGSNGNRIFIGGANSLRGITRLEKLKDISSYLDTDIFTGYNGLEKDAYINLYKTLGNDGVQALIERIKDGSWTDSDAEMLNDIGIFLKGNPNKNKNTNDGRSTLGSGSGTGIGNSIPSTNIAGINWTKNGDGTYNLVSGQDNNIFNNKNRIYFNDNVLKSLAYTNPLGNYEQLRGGFLWDGKFIPKEIASDINSQFYKNLEYWIDNNRHNNFGTLNVDDLGLTTDPFTTYDANTFFLPGLKNNNKNMRFRSYVNPSNQDEVLYEYYDDDSNRDIYGYVTPEALKRIKFNYRTGEISELDPAEGLPTNYQADTSTNPRWKNYSERANGYYELNIPEDPNNPSGPNTSFFVNPYDRNDVWYYKDGMSQPFKLAPSEIETLIQQGVLHTNPQVFDSNGVVTRKQDERFQQNEGSPWGETWMGYLLNSSPTVPLYRWMFPGSIKVDGKDWNRTPHNIFKHQTGGVIQFGKTEGENIDSTTKNSKVKDSKKSANLKEDFKTGDLTEADKLQLTATIGDIISLAAAIPTGGNPIAAGIGFGSSLTSFGADVKRDGFQLRDAGSLALNLGLDAVSLLPGVGLVGKTGKIAKNLKNVMHIIRPMLLASGAVNAVSAANNIAQGKGTIDDLKSLSAGLMSIRGIKNLASEVHATKYAPKNTGAKPKTSEQARNEYLDKLVKEKGYAKHEGNTVRWANSDGTIKDYNMAVEDLTNAGLLNITRPMRAKWAAEAAATRTGNMVSGVWSNRLNPFSKYFYFNPNSRVLADNFTADPTQWSIGQGRTYWRLARGNEDIAKQIADNNLRLFRSNRGNIVVVDNDTPILVHKKGGKIQKIRWGDALLKTLGKKVIDFSGVTKRIGFNFEPLVTSKFIQSADKKSLTTSDNEWKNIVNQYTVKPETDIQSTSDQVEDPRFGNSSNKVNINPNWIINGLRYGITQNANKKNRDYQLQAAESAAYGQIKPFVNRTYKQLNLDNINRSEADRIDQASFTKSVTSDPNHALAERAMKAGIIDNIKREANSTRSQEITNTANTNIQLKQQYDQQDTDISSHNKQILGQLDAAKAQIKAQYSQLKAANKEQFLNQIQGDLARDQQAKEQSQTQANALEAENNFAHDLNQRYLAKWQAYNVDPKNTTKYKTLEEFAMATDPSGFTALKNQHLSNIPINTYNRSQKHSIVNMFDKIDPVQYTNWNFTPKTTENTFNYKKGGTISRRRNNYRSVEEEMRLENHMALLRAVENLNENIWRLILNK